MQMPRLSAKCVLPAINALMEPMTKFNAPLSGTPSLPRSSADLALLVTTALTKTSPKCGLAPSVTGLQANRPSVPFVPQERVAISLKKLLAQPICGPIKVTNIAIITPLERSPSMVRMQPVALPLPTLEQVKLSSSLVIMASTPSMVEENAKTVLKVTCALSQN